MSKYELVLDRLSKFFGYDLVKTALAETEDASRSSSALVGAVSRTLTKRETTDNVNMLAFFKERFCSAPDEAEVVFD